MAYLDQLQNLQEVVNRQRAQFITQLGITDQKPYASFYPEWETNVPQYPSPSPWSLAQQGYRTNELVYTCIQQRASAVAEAKLRVVQEEDDEVEEVNDHPMMKLMKKPTPGLSEQEFWQVVETYLLIAGFSAWEKERDNNGNVIRLWPMRPDWCSFIRGQQKPIAAIRYQPYGMQFADIPIEDVVLFQYFDPLYPLLKGFSPLMVALDLVDTDNTATRIIRQFLGNGNFLGGVLTTEQTLVEAEASRIRERWKQEHGGAENAGDIAVFGKGVKFEPYSMTFKEATFPELDSRSEARICMVFRVPPMLISAKVGMDRSTYSNYKEARQGFYESTISSEWQFLAGQMAEQLLPEYGDESLNCVFDTKKVKALQEDRTSMVDRAVKLYQSGIAKLNEARREANLDAMDEGDLLKAPQLPLQNDPSNADPKNVIEDDRTPEELAKAKEEVTAFRKFAKARIKEGKQSILASFEFKYITLDEQTKLLNEFSVKADNDLLVLAEALNKYALAVNNG
jgi:HK97 family phage portal protein